MTMTLYNDYIKQCNYVVASVIEQGDIRASVSEDWQCQLRSSGTG